MNQPQKPNTPQKYGHARRIIPIRRRIWQKVLIRWAVVLGIGVAFVIFCIISGDAFRNDLLYHFGGCLPQLPSEAAA